ncbi:DUF5924 family protein [Pseudomonas benzenivorans]|uniref:DUF2914 domain-containing protein n=1 Tax=Pseudomonas benzenivorans TaxID=556533 RepID=A0ABY5HFY7_9PSED|nr:DUF5924 family protein [Pseudomonas benzenivorans]UTW09906.1 DUF2914 domain-containing protein [Pseudomonas benzenivorans]
MLQRSLPTLLRLAALIQRHPWLVAIFGFASGLASFLLVERQAQLASVLALVMLASWLWLALENLLRASIARWFGLKLPPPLLRYATQLIHQESLFFVLPFFFITTTWNSGQALFSALLGAAALVSIIDPLYYRWLAPRRWLFLAFHTLTLFAVLLTALPIILQLTTAQSYQLALAVAVLLSFPSLYGSINVAAWWRGLLLLGLTLALGASGWLARFWVPPATLWLTEVALSSEFDGYRRTPGKRVKQLDLEQLRRQGLYAYAAISAPRGLDERIYHVWLHEGKEVERIALTIHGGRKQGYRAWTRKQNFPTDALGRWQVQVVTEAGQMIGVLRFRVLAPTAAAPSTAPVTPTDAALEVDEPALPVQPKNQ